MCFSAGLSRVPQRAVCSCRPLKVGPFSSRSKTSWDTLCFQLSRSVLRCVCLGGPFTHTWKDLINHARSSLLSHAFVRGNKNSVDYCAAESTPSCCCCFSAGSGRVLLQTRSVSAEVAHPANNPRSKGLHTYFDMSINSSSYSDPAWGNSHICKNRRIMKFIQNH